MSDNNDSSINRRNLLRTIGSGAVVGAVGTGTAGATSSGWYVVGTKDKQTAERAKPMALGVYRELDFGDVGFAVAGRFPEQALEKLENNPNVRYVEEDGQLQAIGESVPWGIERTDADRAQDDGYVGSGADIAIVDTGIDSDHPDLQGNLGSGESFVSCDGGATSNTCAESWDDDQGHGTHCAGTAAAVDNSQSVVGMAPSATLHAVKVLGDGGYGSYSDIAAGIRHVADQGWDVASLSLGGSSESYAVSDAIQYATDNGVLCVAAAGNSGSCTDCVMFPARDPNVVAVSATTSSDALAYFSSQGPEIDIAAPGSSIVSTVPGGTATYSGTSMACPHVSGAAGLLMANGYSNTEARARLEDTAEDIGLSSNEQGNGLLDAEAALGDTSNDNMIGEAGTVSVDENWQTVSLDGSYTDPVVVTSVGTYNDPDPVHARVRNAGSGSFEVKLEEWEYQDGAHAKEGVNYVVLESGSHTTDAGFKVVAGTITANGGGWTTVGFSPTWNAQSHTYTQVMSNNDSTPTSTRVTRPGEDSFDVICQEEETNTTAGDTWTNDHGDETVGYVVTQPRPGGAGGTGESIASALSTDAWSTAELQDTYDRPPVAVQRTQSFFGRNAADVRARNQSESSCELMIQEEKSDDSETSHVREYVATMAFELGPITEP